jgi:ferredoxin
MIKTNNAYENCTGCAVCLLNCPVWRTKKDLTLTPYGRFKAMQWSVETGETPDSIESCTLCAACEVLCPAGNEITEVTLEERRRLNQSKKTTPDYYPKETSEVFDASIIVDKEVAVVLNKAACNDAMREKVTHTLGGIEKVSLIEADPSSFEAGMVDIDEGIVKAIFKGAREVVVFEGLLLRPIREILKGKSVVSIGEYLLKKSVVRGLLLSTDLYIVDARSYNLDHERLVRLYDDLKKDVGLTMNLDLHRSAVSLGRDNFSRDGGEDLVETQARWILEGRTFERIVVENPLDADAFRSVTDAPVVSLLELT